MIIITIESDYHHVEPIKRGLILSSIRKQNIIDMAIIITDGCINCDACISECPNNAIYEPDQKWSYSDKTILSGSVISPKGLVIDANSENEPLSDEFYFIVSNKCTECKGFHDEPQCATVCPVDCCIPDENHMETEEDLLKKKVWLHGE